MNNENTQSRNQRSEPVRRRRPALSCIECRRRKIKCDRKEPCGNCVSWHSQCAYKISRRPEVDKQLFAQAGSQSCLTPPQSLHGHSESATLGSPNVAGVAHQSGSSYGTTPRQRLTTSESGNASSLSGSNDVEVELHAPETEVQRLENEGSVLSNEQSDDRQEVFVKKTRVTRSAKLLVEIRKCAKSIVFFHIVTGGVNGDSFQGVDVQDVLAECHDLIMECKLLARQMKIGRPTRQQPQPDYNLAIPSRAQADEMTRLYFRYFESTHRILHIPTFWADYHQYWDDPTKASASVRLQVLLVIAIGSRLYAQVDDEMAFQQNVHQWIYAAQTWLSGPWEKNRLTLTGIQIHCLTMLARQLFSLGTDLVWISMGSLVHEAMQTGLHRDPRHLPPMSHLEAELRRRLWATILELVVQSSLDCEMPPRLSLDEFDTEPPANVNDDEMNSLTQSLPLHLDNELTSTSVQLRLLKSWPTRLRILKLVSGISTDLPYQSVLDLSAELTKACGACILPKHTTSSDRGTKFHQALLDFLVRRFLLPLHAPFAYRAHSNPRFYYSRKVCLDTALAIMAAQSDEAFCRLKVVDGGLFRNGIRNAGFTIGLELLKQTQAQRLDGTLGRLSDSRLVLQRVLRELVSLSTERIRHGEFNVKNHMFLSTILAECEAIAKGQPCELKIVRSARDSLESSRNILQIQVDLRSPPTSVGTAPLDFDGELSGFSWDWETDSFLENMTFA